MYFFIKFLILYIFFLKVERGQIKFPSSNPTPPFSYGNGISRWTHPNYFLAGYFVGKGKIIIKGTVSVISGDSPVTSSNIKCRNALAFAVLPHQLILILFVVLFYK